MIKAIVQSDAKAGLSSIARNVHNGGGQYEITVRGVPSATTVPIPKSASAEPKATGMLAGKRPVATRAGEKAAYRLELEAKYADPA